LQEIPALLECFGFEGLMALLDSGALDIVCDAMTVGSIGQFNDNGVTVGGDLLPLGSYRLLPVYPGGSRDEFLDGVLGEAGRLPLAEPETNRLLDVLRQRVLGYDRAAASSAAKDAITDVVSEQSVLRRALAMVVRKELNVPNSIASRLAIHAEPLGQVSDFRVATDLVKMIGVSDAQAHSLVERAVLSVAGLNQRVHLMRTFNALTGLQDEDLSLFEAKLSFLVNALDPSDQERRLDRVVAIAGLPRMSGVTPPVRIDAGKLLEVRRSDECRQFRDWLRGIDSESDAEIDARFEAVRGRLAGIVEGRIGRIARFAVTTAMGFIPAVGTVAGPAASATDSFIVDRLVGKPGPTVFLSRNYKSLFRD
jgi:hypothetical protein